MKRDDVVAVGKLVLAAVIVGALIATGAPPLADVLAKVLSRWMGAG